MFNRFLWLEQKDLLLLLVDYLTRTKDNNTIDLFNLIPVDNIIVFDLYYYLQYLI